MDRVGDDISSGIPVSLRTRDGEELAGQLWLPASAQPIGAVVINPATAVKASYYHRFAKFLGSHGYAVLTYDYRGISASRHRPPTNGHSARNPSGKPASATSPISTTASKARSGPMRCIGCETASCRKGIPFFPTTAAHMNKGQDHEYRR